jgi:hypothetical protein
MSTSKTNNALPLLVTLIHFSYDKKKIEIFSQHTPLTDKTNSLLLDLDI